MSTDQHARLAPSHSSCWSVCTASVPFVEANEHRLPPDKGSAEADEGTEAHFLAHDKWLKTGVKPEFPNAEMERVVTAYVKFVLDLIKDIPGCRYGFETKVSLFYLPNQRGTVDVWIVDLATRRIWIIDLKYGRGVHVEARNNKQLACYAESMLQQLDGLFEIGPEWLITMIIYQPRDRHDSNAVRLWAIFRSDLSQFCESISFAAQLIINAPSRTEFVVEEQGCCLWCRGKGICDAYRKAQTAELTAANVAEDHLETKTFPAPESLTRDQRVRLIKARKGIEAWLEAVEKQEVHELMNNAPRAGLKLVEGKSNRRWVDQEDAKNLLRNYLSSEQVTPPGDLISPAQAEDLLKGVEVSTKFSNKLASLITKPQGKPTLVPEEDKRPALTFDPTYLLTDDSPL